MDDMPGRFPPPPDDGQPGPRMPTGPGGTSPGQYPLDIGRIFELTFSLFRFNWRTFVVAALIVMIPVAAVLAVAGYFTSSATADWYAQLQDLALGRPTTLPSMDTILVLLVGLLIGALAAIGAFVAEAAVTRAAVGTYNGERPNAVGSVRFAVAKLHVLGGAYLLTFLASLGIAFIGVVIASLLVIATSSDGQITRGPGVFFGLVIFVAAFAALILLTVRWALVIPVIVIEGLGPVAALRRSWGLVSGSSWRVLGYLLAFGLLFGLVAALLTFALTVIVSPASLTARSLTATIDPARLAIVNFGGNLINAVLMPFTAIGMMLLYMDLRFRKGEPVPQPGAAVPDRPAG
jgi:Membrane domain of glycerophosphoryl diester phosphodiesterase